MKILPQILKPTRIKMCIFGISLLFLMNSCTKDEVQKSNSIANNETEIVETKGDGTITHNVYYKGEKFVLKGKQDFENKLVNWENIPDKLKEWNKTGEEEVVSQVLLYDDRTDVYLFDSKEEHQEMFTFAEGNQNRLKGQNEVTLKTYNDIATSGSGGTIYGNILRSIANCCWAKRCFGNFWCYGDGAGSLPSSEDNEISGIQLGQTWWGAERAQFVCCQFSNWGGSRLYITKVTTNPIAYANMFNYNYTYIWNRNWNDAISSYELFQTNSFLSGQRI
jgi:hypothetical protein